MHQMNPVIFMFPALTTSSALPRRFAPEQGTGPDTGSRTNKLRLLARLPAQVSAAIKCYDLIWNESM